MTPLAGTAYVDGSFVPIADARISILDWGFLHSDATYDVVHVWRRRFFRLADHLDRFAAGADRLRLTLPVPRDELARILAECVVRSGLDDAYVEMVLTRGVSPTFSRDPRDAVNNLICFALPMSWVLPPERREVGLSVLISDVVRIPPESVDPRVKNYHWLDFVAGLFDAFDQGADNVVLTDGHGHLREGPGFNVFVAKDGVVATPERGVLEGITRRTAIEIARERGGRVEERAVRAAEARRADELFATSTAGGIMPITRVDREPVADGRPGRLTAELIERYWELHADARYSTAVHDIVRHR